MIERLTSTRTATGPLFCPRCCWKLGRAESPAIGYLIACGGCKRGLQIVEVDDGGVAVIVANSRRDADAVFLDLDHSDLVP